MITITKSEGLKEISFNPAILFVEMEDGSVRRFSQGGQIAGVTLVDDVLTLDPTWNEILEAEENGQDLVKAD